jgi:hypothetical protein
VIELVPQVGDFVDTGEPLFVLYGGAAAIADRALAGIPDLQGLGGSPGPQRITETKGRPARASRTARSRSDPSRDFTT